MNFLGGKLLIICVFFLYFNQVSCGLALLSLGTSELLLEALRPAMIAERLNPKPNALGCNKKVRTTRQK